MHYEPVTLKYIISLHPHKKWHQLNNMRVRVVTSTHPDHIVSKDIWQEGAGFEPRALKTSYWTHSILVKMDFLIEVHFSDWTTSQVGDEDFLIHPSIHSSTESANYCTFIGCLLWQFLYFALPVSQTGSQNMSTPQIIGDYLCLPKQDGASEMELFKGFLCSST